VADEADRKVPRSESVFIDGANAPSITVHAIEGVQETGEISFKKLIFGDDVMMVEVFRRKGMIDPKHNHPDHESICYLVSGRARVWVGGQEFIAEPGSAWLHAPGVDHYSEALEDCVQVEVKSPPRKTWDGD
jgi:quercetin dioxygenase-like cupin family protein